MKKDIDDVDMGETPLNKCFVVLVMPKTNSLSPSSALAGLEETRDELVNN